MADTVECTDCGHTNVPAEGGVCPDCGEGQLGRVD